jgi:ribosomal protein S15P/S13E
MHDPAVTVNPAARSSGRISGEPRSDELKIFSLTETAKQAAEHVRQNEKLRIAPAAE